MRKQSAQQAALARVVDHLKSRPSRTWSLIITFYGDAIVPRGGSAWLGTLLEFFRALGIEEGVIRTAMSRLAADGWIARTKIGRNSFYRLAEKGLAPFRAATEHIYYAQAPDWTGRFDGILLGGASRETLRDALAARGYGSPLPGLWLALESQDPESQDPEGQDPEGQDLAGISPPALRVSLQADRAAGRELAARAWPLDEIGEAYRRFVATFSPLDAALTAQSGLAPIEALVARVLLIHEYRRIILRDPILPAALLPEDWPGVAARRLCAALYRKLLGASELWLDAHVVTETGPAPKPGTEFYARFGGVDART